MIVIFNQKHKHDYPKKLGDMSLAWYNHGKCCVSRHKRDYQVQTQNVFIKEMNGIIRKLWNEVSHSAKRDLKKYSLAYKRRYPALRKRGNNTYSIFLMICHSLIKFYHLNTLSSDYLYLKLKNLLSSYTIYQLVQKGLLKPVKNAYQLKKYMIIAKQEIIIIKTGSDHYVNKHSKKIYEISAFFVENKSPPSYDANNFKEAACF